MLILTKWLSLLTLLNYILFNTYSYFQIFNKSIDENLFGIFSLYLIAINFILIIILLKNKILNQTWGRLGWWSFFNYLSNKNKFFCFIFIIYCLFNIFSYSNIMTEKVGKIYYLKDSHSKKTIKEISKNEYSTYLSLELRSSSSFFMLFSFFPFVYSWLVDFNEKK